MTSRDASFGIAAAGVVGVAIEDTRNTYKAPQKYLPIISESLSTSEDTVFRRVLQGTVDPIGVKPGNESHEGTVQMEFLHDCIPYFLHAMRGTITKSGSGTDRVYKLLGSHEGSADKYGQTLSITLVRNNVVFAYTGCVVGSLQLGITDGLLTATMNIMAADEAAQTAPAEVFPTSVPFGAGEYDLQIPTASQIYDADTFTIEINDNAESQFRLQDERRGPWFIKFGEREVSATIDRDFDSRAQFDVFKDITAQSITLRAEDADNDDRYMSFVMPACYIDSFDVSLSGSPGDLVRANTRYMGVHHAATGSSYTLEIGTSENIHRPPAPPTMFAAAVGNTQTVLTWAASPDTNVTDYEYQNKLATAANWPDNNGVEVDSRTTVTATIASLTNGMAYNVRIRSKIVEGSKVTRGGWSDTVTVTPSN